MCKYQLYWTKTVFIVVILNTKVLFFNNEVRIYSKTLIGKVNMIDHRINWHDYGDESKMSRIFHATAACCNVRKRFRCCFGNGNYDA